MKIKIKDFKLITNIGIYDWEKNFDRELNLNLEIKINNQIASSTDNIEDTIDYELIYNQIKKLVAEKKFNLIEKLASEIIDLVMLDKRIDQCKIEIDKINIFSDVKSCSVQLEKNRNDF
jgi:dihydroneopterin aldolase